MSVSEPEQTVFIRGRVPESVRARFKSICALQRRDMSEVLVELINKWLEEYEPDRPAPTETKAPSATKAKRQKESKEAK